MRSALQRYVDDGSLAGTASLVWRAGRVVQTTSVGLRDLEAGLPVGRDTIFRIASMTKPITAVAALMLIEDGRFGVDTPVTAVAPELAPMRVLRDPEGPLEDAVDAERPITFGDLLTHRSGLTYGDFHRGPVGLAYANALGGQIDNPLSPDEWIARLATLPLIDQPGAGFHYGLSSDLLGFLIARVEGAPLGDVLEARIFERLGMHDTGFVVPESARARRAALCGFDEAGAPTPLAAAPGGHALKERPASMTYESGGPGSVVHARRLSRLRASLHRGRSGERRATHAAGHAGDDDDEPAHAGPARGGADAGAAGLCRGARIRDGRGRGDGAREGESASMPRGRRNRWMARRWRVPGSGPDGSASATRCR